MDKTDNEKIVLSAGEMAEIERRAVKYPTKTGKLTPVVIRLFIETIEKTYGIDLGVETEEMKNEREAKQSKRKRVGAFKLDRKQSNRRTDDF